MSSAARYTRPPEVPPLVPGQRLTQREFHRRYEQYPEDTKFELIEGIVYTVSPLSRRHGRYQACTGGLFWQYASATPGVELLDNATTILDDQSERQPDLEMRILSEFGGQSRETADDYVRGAPEHVTEIANSSKDIDLNQKRDAYKRARVIEYLVVCAAEQELHWFHFPSGKEIKPDRRGIYRSRVFPGLWLDGPALLRAKRSDSSQSSKKGLPAPATPGSSRVCMPHIASIHAPDPSAFIQMKLAEA